MRINPALHTYLVYEIGLHGLSQAEIARRCGISRAMVNMVITGRKNSAMAQHKIATLLGLGSWGELVVAAELFQTLVVEAHPVSRRMA